MRISDWSSDVCSSDRGSTMGGSALPGGMPNVGRVAKIGVRAVNVITRDGKKHLIPNELLMTQAVENWSFASPEVRVRRSEERRVGRECGRTCRSRWSTYN